MRRFELLQNVQNDELQNFKFNLDNKNAAKNFNWAHFLFICGKLWCIVWLNLNWRFQVSQQSYKYLDREGKYLATFRVNINTIIMSQKIFTLCAITRRFISGTNRRHWGTSKLCNNSIWLSVLTLWIITADLTTSTQKRFAVRGSKAMLPILWLVTDTWWFTPP